MRKCGCNINTDKIGIDEVIVVSAGMDFQNYRDRNPTVLFKHDPKRSVAKTVEIKCVGSEIRAVAQFPDPGVSADSDLVYGLIKCVKHQQVPSSRINLIARR